MIEVESLTIGLQVRRCLADSCFCTFGQGAVKPPEVGPYLNKGREKASLLRHHHETKIVLIGEKQFAEYMVDYSIGVSTISTYTLEKLMETIFAMYSANYSYSATRGNIFVDNRRRSNIEKVSDKNGHDNMLI